MNRFQQRIIVRRLDRDVVNRNPPVLPFGISVDEVLIKDGGQVGDHDWLPSSKKVIALPRGVIRTGDRVNGESRIVR